jgi:hypothetical protein
VAWRQKRHIPAPLLHEVLDSLNGPRAQIKADVVGAIDGAPLVDVHEG